MNTFFTPGPAQLYPGMDTFVAEALAQQIPSISHRSSTYKSIHEHTVSALRNVFELPDDFYVFFHASATEIWERLIQNLVSQTSYHFVNGSFSKRFYQAAVSLQRQATAYEVPWGEGFDLDKTQIPADTEMINVTRNETSTGVATSPSFIYEIRKRYPDALLTVDAVSSAPYIRWDWSQIDALYFSVQKCFGLPAGLGVLLLNERCMEKARAREAAGESLGTYHSFTKQYDKYTQHQTVETPNVLNIYLLDKVCQDMLSKGLESIRTEIDLRAESIYELIENELDATPFVKNPSFRSPTVIVADIVGGSQRLIANLAEKQLIVGNGYGKMKGKQIRIANFPALSREAVNQLLTELKDFS